MILYHATSIKNIKSIKKKGLLSMWEGVYLTNSKESAIRWIGFRLRCVGEEEIAIIEVDVSPNSVVEGNDHSPLMESIFGVGKSLLSPKSIPPSKIISIEQIKI